MKLIADSGSTKTDWTLINTPHPQRCDVVATFHTQGITPIHQQPDVIRQIIGHELISQLSTFPRASLIQSGVLESPLMSNIEVFFYGSGCTPTHVPMMKRMLGEVFSSQNIEVHSDLTAAARALCQPIVVFMTVRTSFRIHQHWAIFWAMRVAVRYSVVSL